MPDRRFPGYHRAAPREQNVAVVEHDDPAAGARQQTATGRFEQWEREYQAQHPRERAVQRAHDLVYLLTRARIWRGLTQQQLGDRIARTQPAIARIEKGLSDPKLSTVEDYAAALNLRLVLVDDENHELHLGDPRLNAAPVQSGIS